ncbi:type II toxin-antitoxin system PrlF family antitoxin [Castellaniella sp.]|uniref:type II toxin-antitoxin system PrlF family antitoxin n=1 Tax=Castellaniella sp. TaxID=1955812 RepID=UPI0035601D18
MGEFENVVPATAGAESTQPRAASHEDGDLGLGPFLDVLAHDIASHPERLQALDAGLVQQLQALVGGIEVDLDAALSKDDE